MKSIVGEKDTYTAEDFDCTGVNVLGGCESCHATIAAYNTYPSKSGYWRCADCIGNTGYDTVTAFRNDEFSENVRCPYCRAGEISIREIRDETEEYPHSNVPTADTCSNKS